MEDIIAAGKKYMKQSRFRLMAMGAVLSSVLGEAVSAGTSALQVASETKHFPQAIEALQDGDIDKARRLLTGDRDSLYTEILTRIGPLSALNFKKAMDEVFEWARSGSYD